MVEAKKHHIKKGENLLANKQKQAIKSLRKKIVAMIETKFQSQGLNKQMRRFIDTDNKCRASEWVGRLVVIVHEGHNVVGKDKRTNAFLRCKIGCSHTKQTDTVKNATRAPDFADEKLTFDVLDGNSLCENNDLNLQVQLFDDNYIFDTLLGTCNVKLKTIMKTPNTKITKCHQLHLFKFRSGYVNTAKVKLSLIYHNAHPGLVLFTLFDGRNLANRGGLIDEQDPYVVIKINKKETKRSRTINNGGVNPNFNGEQILLLCDETSFQNDVSIQVRDDDLIGSDVIGKCKFSLYPYLENATKTRNRKQKTTKKGSTDNANGPEIQSFTLMHNNKLCGELRMSVQFLPAGSLTVDVVKVSERALIKTRTKLTPHNSLRLAISPTPTPSGSPTRTPSYL